MIISTNWGQIYQHDRAYRGKTLLHQCFMQRLQKKNPLSWFGKIGVGWFLLWFKRKRNLIALKPPILIRPISYWDLFADRTYMGLSGQETTPPSGQLWCSPSTLDQDHKIIKLVKDHWDHLISSSPTISPQRWEQTDPRDQAAAYLCPTQSAESTGVGWQSHVLCYNHDQKPCCAQTDLCFKAEHSLYHLLGTRR